MGRRSHYDEHKFEILVLVDQTRQRHGRPPSIRELADSVGVGVATAHLYLKKLAEEGAVEWHSNSHRSLRLTSQGSQTLSSLGLSSP